MTKTIKTEFPPIRMRAVGGKLEPVSQFDEERIESFSHSRDVMVYVVQEPHSKLIRKWWAVINNTLKHCKTPWTNSVAASSAVKLALGKVTPFKTTSGNWGQTPISLNELEDDELSETFEGMVRILSELTGVDVLDLKSEAADVGPDPVEEPEKAHEEPGKVEEPPKDEPDPDSRYTDLIGYGRYLCTMLQNFIDDGSIEQTDGCLELIQGAWNDANDKASGGIFAKADDETVKKGKSITNWADMVVKKEAGITKYMNRVSETLNCSPSELKKKG